MRGVDVNLLVYAHRQDAERHQEFREWLEEARVGEEPLGLSDLVLSGFLRVVTHPRIFKEPTPLPEAMQFALAVRSSPAAVPLAPGPGHWAEFRRLCQQAGPRGNQVPDAYLAAMAIEAGATWMTADRGFARFPGLRWAHPLD
jgi:toxin-antitoxin system PIN domain toxin